MVEVAPAWQQDAIARLYVNRELSAEDIDDIYALSKAEAGVPDEKGRVAKKLESAEVAPQTNPTRLVQIVAVKELQHVNALVQGGRLPISPTGLTVIYGENGAGKSGYSRVFKHACRARDRREPILPNARLDPKKVGTAQAVFETIVDGAMVDLVWKHRTEPPLPLTDISIFDTHCARAYIDNQGDFAYVPYGNLRLAWERYVEEVLLNGAIQRFTEGVSTLRLREVEVSNDDYRAIKEGMAKCSKFEHDAASRVGRLPIPHLDELSADIEKLESWREIVVRRRTTIRAERG
ncbi:hypothetical protein [Burkholderia gladioli]|uniref:hypothetical protein n=1 Tax=Burkholderia gladioli TaxID=28095 RepID=UPI001FC8A614|nr:hypothetical protein [Burkholderia gladioli]